MIARRWQYTVIASRIVHVIRVRSRNCFDTLRTGSDRRSLRVSMVYGSRQSMDLIDEVWAIDKLRCIAGGLRYTRGRVVLVLHCWNTDVDTYIAIDV